MFYLWDQLRKSRYLRWGKSLRHGMAFCFDGFPFPRTSEMAETNHWQDSTSFPIFLAPALCSTSGSGMELVPEEFEEEDTFSPPLTSLAWPRTRVFVPGASEHPWFLLLTRDRQGGDKDRQAGTGIQRWTDVEGLTGTQLRGKGIFITYNVCSVDRAYQADYSCTTKHVIKGSTQMTRMCHSIYWKPVLQHSDQHLSTTVNPHTRLARRYNLSLV